MIFKINYNEIIMFIREINIYIFIIFAKIFIDILIIIYKIFEKKKSR